MQGDDITLWQQLYQRQVFNAFGFQLPVGNQVKGQDAATELSVGLSVETEVTVASRGDKPTEGAGKK